MENKMTKREVLTMVINGLKGGDRQNFTLTTEDESATTEYNAEGSIIVDFTNDEVESIIAYCENELNLLTAKAAKAKSTQSKTQKENEGIKDKILETLARFPEPVTVTEIMKSSDDFAECSNQKISALLSQLVKDNKVIKIADKKKSLFALNNEN